MPETRPQEVPLRADGLQLEERRGFQETFWKAQRLLWLVYVGILVAALAGLTGRGGPFSLQTGSTSAGTVELPRFARRGSTDVVLVDFTTPALQHRLALDHGFLDHFELETVTPRPMAEASDANGTLLTFDASGQPPHRVTLHVRMRSVGLAAPALELDGAPMSFRTLFLP